MSLRMMNQSGVSSDDKPWATMECSPLGVQELDDDTQVHVVATVFTLLQNSSILSRIFTVKGELRISTPGAWFQVKLRTPSQVVSSYECSDSQHLARNLGIASDTSDSPDSSASQSTAATLHLALLGGEAATGCDNLTTFRMAEVPSAGQASPLNTPSSTFASAEDNVASGHVRASMEQIVDMSEMAQVPPWPVLSATAWPTCTDNLDLPRGEALTNHEATCTAPNPPESPLWCAETASRTPLQKFSNATMPHLCPRWTTMQTDSCKWL